MRSLNCAKWLQNSAVDGPGIRSVLFLQGCSRHCPGCHNPVTHDAKNGQVMSIGEVYSRILEKCRNKRITISGGEPLEQAESLFELLRYLKGDGFNICLYTSNELENVPKKIVALLDYLKCGRFDKDLKTFDTQYYGSANQKFYIVNEGKATIYTESWSNEYERLG